MFAWVPILIPLLGALIVLLSPAWPIARWQGARSNWEIRRNWGAFGAYMVVNVFVCGIIACLMWGGAIRKTKFPEVWNSEIVGIEHQEEWTERVTYTVSHTTTDSKGKSHTTYETKHRTDHNGPYWYTHDEYGKREKISGAEYNRWKNIWKDEKMTGVNKGSSAGWDKEIDGNIYRCVWPRTFETIYPKTEIHIYENKVRVSDSVFKWKEPTKELIKKYRRPADLRNTSPVINYGGRSPTSDERLYLQRVNASLGPKFQIHSLLVIFGKDELRSVVSDVLSAWQGPNKNELVVFISYDGETVRWVEVHSWLDNTTLHARMRDGIMEEGFSFQKYGELLLENVPTGWRRKHFSEFNNYLRVKISPLWMIFALIISAMFGFGSYWFINQNRGI